MEQQIIAGLTALALTFLPAQHNAPQKPKVEEKPKVITHSVKEGETLASIAQTYYKNQDYWTNIWNDNTWIKNPNIIENGWRIKIEEEKGIEPISQNIKTKIITSYTNLPPNTKLINDIKQSSFDNIYQEAGFKYGVPWQILYGLHLTETGLRDGAIFNGQGSGAQGPMQFMPGTFRAYQIDGNGDGFADINNAVDSIYTAANYLKQHGSLMQGLYSYGGNVYGTLNAAASRGYNP